MRVESNPSFLRPRGSALRLALAALLFAQAAYAVVFIRSTSFMIGGERYYSLMDDAMISMRYAENIAAGQTDPARVVQAWVESPGHCLNLMDPRYRVLGVGYFFESGDRFGHYWTQNFGG